MTPRFTVVAPMLNEAENVPAMAAEIAEACADIGPFEAVFVNDGSTDGTADAIAAARESFPWLREVRHAAPCGQSAAVRSGVRAAKAPVVCTIDGDGQNPPSEIPKLVAPLLDGPADLGLVAGQRVDRQDTASKKVASRMANRLRAFMLKDDTRDTGCGLKAFPRDVFLALPFFDHIHRYLPALVKREGLRIELVDVSHRAREAGSSKYTNFGRAMVGIADLLGVWWLLRRRKVPAVTYTDT
ncbi:MAG: glycosyltransferase family 2 protein [Pseudomonadota bacterium]